MGAILEEIYEIVTKKAGLKGRTRLAEKTGIPRARAAENGDTSELVTLFKSAASDILGTDIDEFIVKD